MKNFIRISKPFFGIAVSFLSFLLVLIVKITISLLFGGGSNEDSSDDTRGFGGKSFYVIDEKGNEIIDDNVTMVFELDDQVNYKD